VNVVQLSLRLLHALSGRHQLMLLLSELLHQRVFVLLLCANNDD
jgi:hypothetical protein